MSELSGTVKMVLLAEGQPTVGGSTVEVGEEGGGMAEEVGDAEDVAVADGVEL